MKIKFCGCRCVEDVEKCNVVMPDYMGMILSKGFQRTIDPETARQMVREKERGIVATGIFVDEPLDVMLRTLDQVPLDIIQLHGHENSEMIFQLRKKTGLPVWKAVRVQNENTIKEAQKLGADMLVLEGFIKGKIGGTGVTADWDLIAKARPLTPFFLAGGLSPENVREAMKIVQPVGVDLSSGIETAGKKDIEKMKKIVDIIRGGYNG